VTSLRAAVYIGVDRPLRLETLELDEPGPGEVAVSIEASGLCHSDLHVMLGEWSERPPMVLGHEGCGVVESVGEDVHQFAPGDRVVLCWYAPCDECARCRAGRPWVCLNTRANSSLMPDGGTRLRRLGGEPVRSYLAVGSFGQRAVVPASGAVRVDGRLPAELGALIGCGVATGVGAVTNTARVEPGASVVVIGCGGVGLSVVMGAALAGAHPIIAVDVEDAKLEQARDVGATHAVRGDGDVAAAVKAIVPGGADYAFEAIGLQRTIELMPDLICLGGVAVMVGMTPEDVRVSFSGFGMAEFGHSVLGSNYGSSVAPIDFPRIAALFEAGKLPIDRLITRRVALDEVNSAFDDMRARRGGRAVIVYG